MSVPVGYLPRPTDLASGLTHSLLLLRLRWRMIRRPAGKAAVWVGLGLLFLLILGASNIGQVIRYVAESDGDRTAAGAIALNYMFAFQRGEFGGLAAIALGSAVGASLFSPLTGSANLSLVSPEDLQGLRMPRLHRYFDSLFIHSLSTIGFLQIVSLTAVASLITIDGNSRTYALGITWAVWAVLILFTAAEGWLIEITYRRFGIRTRRILGLALVAAIAAALMFDPNHGSTLFGLGNLYADVLQQNLSVPGWVPFALLAAVGGGLLVAGATLCNAALARQAVPVTVHQKVRVKPLSADGDKALRQLVWRQLIRTSEVYRPIAVIVFVGIPAVWITQGNVATMTTLVVAVPLAVGLSWGVNFFGIIGPGMTWLASLPGVMRRLLDVGARVALGTALFIAVVIWAPAVAVGMVPLSAGAAVASGAVVSTVLTTRSALAKAVHRPFLARLGNRGDTVVPPLTAVNYTMRFALWSGQIGVLVMSQSSAALQGILVVTLCAWAAVRYLMLRVQWSSRERQADVTALVAAG